MSSDPRLRGRDFLLRATGSRGRALSKGRRWDHVRDEQEERDWRSAGGRGAGAGGGLRRAWEGVNGG